MNLSAFQKLYLKVYENGWILELTEEEQILIDSSDPGGYVIDMLRDKTKNCVFAVITNPCFLMKEEE